MNSSFKPQQSRMLLHGKGYPGVGRLLINDKLVGEVEIPLTTPVMYALTGCGLTCGYGNGEPVAPDDYQTPIQVHREDSRSRSRDCRRAAVRCRCRTSQVDGSGLVGRHFRRPIRSFPFVSRRRIRDGRDFFHIIMCTKPSLIANLFHGQYKRQFVSRSSLKLFQDRKESSAKFACE